MPLGFLLRPRPAAVVFESLAAGTTGVFRLEEAWPGPRPVSRFASMTDITTGITPTRRLAAAAFAHPFQSTASPPGPLPSPVI